MSSDRLTIRPEIQMHRISDAAQITRLHANTIFEHIKAGRLKSVKIGGRRLIPETALREFLQIKTGE
jgi:excisionase family DNA binding protein